MTVTVEKPEIITLLFKQEESDEDYGSCLWARFYLDLKNYTLQIESDCGDYSYGWIPTSNSETFLHLLSRLNQDYLLDKISFMSKTYSDATFEAVKELIEETAKYESVDISELDWDEIEAACYWSVDECGVADSIVEILKYTELNNKISYGDICHAVEKDYPANAKKIVSVFDSCIKPVIKDMIENRDMTTKEVINELNLLEMFAGTPKAAEAVRIATDAILKQEELENQNPLTLDELRRMCEEPVYIVDLSRYGELNTGWIIFSQHYQEGFVPKGGHGWFSAGGYGKRWLAYRSKPR